MNLKAAVVIFATILLILFVALSSALIKTSDLLELEAQELSNASESILIAKELKNRLLIDNKNDLFYAINKTRPARLKNQQIQEQEVLALLDKIESHPCRKNLSRGLE